MKKLIIAMTALSFFGCVEDGPTEPNWPSVSCEVWQGRYSHTNIACGDFRENVKICDINGTYDRGCNCITKADIKDMVEENRHHNEPGYGCSVMHICK